MKQPFALRVIRSTSWAFGISAMPHIISQKLERTLSTKLATDLGLTSADLLSVADVDESATHTELSYDAGQLRL